MRMGIQLGAMFVLVTMSGAGQIAAGIHLVEVQFRGNTRLESVDLKKCAADLKSRTYEGPEWLGYVTEQVRLLCLQDSGYMKALVEPSTEQLPDKDGTHQFVITFDIDAGPQYRVGNITFKNNRAISDAKALRDLFPIKDGRTPGSGSPTPNLTLLLATSQRPLTSTRYRQLSIRR